MEQDFTKGLSVCIGNYGYYNEGELHDTWITLPLPSFAISRT